MQDMDSDRVALGEFGQQPEHTLGGNGFLWLMPLVDRETGPVKNTSSRVVVFGLVSSVTKTNHETFGPDLKQPNQIINFSVIGGQFYTLASQQLTEWHFTGDTQCLPLYRYTPDGERVSNITEWGLRHINDHYRQEWGAGFDERYPDGIGPEDIFAYTYAVLHDPVYRHDYRVDLLREFPRLPLYHDFEHWARMGRELLDLHIGFETAEPYPMERVDVGSRVRGNDSKNGGNDGGKGGNDSGKRGNDSGNGGNDGGRAILRADRERGVITLDEQTTLTGVPPDAFRYQLGSRSALEWVLDQYKERKPRDPTIRERFNTYRFADHKERVIDLLRRVCTVSVKTMAVVDSMAYWDGDNLIVFDDRDKNEWETAALAEWFGEPGGPDDDPEYQAWLRSLPDIREGEK